METDFKQQFNNRKVLITGALGFIGSNLARRLVERGVRFVQAYCDDEWDSHNGLRDQHSRRMLETDQPVAAYQISGEYAQIVAAAERGWIDQDRVVVRVTATMDDFVETVGGQIVLKDGQSSKRVTTSEYWTLFQRDGRWRLLSIETEAEGRHNLDSEIVASPWADSQVADAALVETAVADAAPADVKTSEIADLDFDGPARAAALDLSLADGRFAPDVLEVAARRAVAAWAEAIDGPDAALAGIATPGAIEALLYPNDDGQATRLVVRGPQVQQVTIAALDAATDPPTMTVTVRVRGARYKVPRLVHEEILGRPGFRGGLNRIAQARGKAIGPLTVEAARDLLTARGVRRDRIHFELFYVEATPPPMDRHVEPGVTGPTSEVTIVLDGRSVSGSVSRDESLLDILPDSPRQAYDMYVLVRTLVDRKIPAVFVESSVSPKNIESLRQGAASKGHEVKIGGQLFSDAMGAAGR